jgi:hypothetical protein
MKGLFKKDKLLIEVSNLDNDKLYDVKISVYSDKRTKTMNSYYWVLVTQLADVLRTSKDELHEQLIKRYSQRDYISLLSNINPSDYFPYYEYQSTFKHNNNTFKSYLVFKRSSDMNKREFSILLDGLISECKECGISTMTPEQVEELNYLESVSNSK